MYRLRVASRVASRAYSQNPAGKPTAPAASSAAPSGGVNTNVPGLSQKIVEQPKEPVGPGAAANAEYKVPEYFCFNRFSFAEAELEMAKYRCPQPSALKK